MPEAECRHEIVDVTATTRSREPAEHSREHGAERVDEIGICRKCGRRVRRQRMAGEWSSWRIDG
jgi:hypothetical protein